MPRAFADPSVAEHCRASRPTSLFAAGAHRDTTALRQSERPRSPLVFVTISRPGQRRPRCRCMPHPGGNVDRLHHTMNARMGGKWLEVAQAARARQRPAWRSSTRSPPIPSLARDSSRAIQGAAGPTLGVIQVAARPGMRDAARNRADRAGCVRAVAQWRPTGHCQAFLADWLHRDLIITLAARHRLPAGYPAALSCRRKRAACSPTAPDSVDQYRLAASVLRGSHPQGRQKPADLPGAGPDQVSSLIINLTTAADAGPRHSSRALLARADEVIE